MGNGCGQGKIKLKCGDPIIDQTHLFKSDVLNATGMHLLFSHLNHVYWHHLHIPKPLDLELVGHEFTAHC